MSNSETRRRSRDRTGTATGNLSEGQLRGGVHAGSYRSPARSLRRSQQEPPQMPWEQGFDWFTFHCNGCGTETYVGREPSQSIEDFALMCEWLYGTPPICSTCRDTSL